MGLLFDILPGAKELKKKLEDDLSKKLGRQVVLPTPGNLNILLGATSGALSLMAVASQAIPGVGTAVGAALAAAGRATAALQSGDVKGAGLAALGALGPAVGDAAATTLGPVVGEVLTTAKAIEDLWAGVPVSARAALPGLQSMVGETMNATGVRVLADKLLAAKGIGGELAARSSAIIGETHRLANAGNEQAKAALALLEDVSAERVKLKIAAGIEQHVTPDDCKALAAQLSYAAASKTKAVSEQLKTAANVANYQGIMAIASAAGQAAATAKANAAANAAAAAALDAARVQAAELAAAVASVTTAAEADNVWALYMKGRPASTKIVEAIQAGAARGNSPKATAAQALLRAAEVRRNKALAPPVPSSTMPGVLLYADGTVTLDGGPRIPIAELGAAFKAKADAAAAAKAKADAAAAAKAKADAAAAARAAVAGPAAPARTVERGFVVTASARILDGTEWIPDDAGGVLGTLVRTSGPPALRMDATERRWVRA
jgi:hypothetical protein